MMSETKIQSVCGFYPVIEASREEAAQTRLANIIEHAHPASVLIARAAGEKLDAQTILPWIETLQSADIAAVLSDDADLVRIVKADGVHLTWSEDVIERFETAREILGGRYMVGVDVGRSRHNAMALGDAGADYIAFGIPPHVEDREAALNRQIELISWWAEIFEVPCVAFNAEETTAIEQLRIAGADFIARTVPKGLSASQTQSWIVETNTALGGVAPVAGGAQ